MWQKTLTIPDGETRSPVLSLIIRGVQSENNLIFYVPAEVAETIAVHVGPSYTEDNLDPSYLPLQNNGTNIVLPAGRATPVRGVLSAAIVLVAGGKVAGDRVITICGVVKG